MIKFNKLKGFQGYHTLLHTNMLSKVREKWSESECMLCIGTCIPALAWGICSACEGVCVYIYIRKIYQEFLCSSTALGNGADSDPQKRVRFGKMTIVGASR